MAAHASEQDRGYLVAAGRQLRRVRRLAGMTQQELADKSGLHNNTIRNWELAKRVPRITDWHRVQRILRESPSAAAMRALQGQGQRKGGKA